MQSSKDALASDRLLAIALNIQSKMQSLGKGQWLCEELRIALQERQDLLKAADLRMEYVKSMKSSIIIRASSKYGQMGSEHYVEAYSLRMMVNSLKNPINQMLSLTLQEELRDARRCLIAYLQSLYELLKNPEALQQLKKSQEQQRQREIAAKQEQQRRNKEQQETQRRKKEEARKAKQKEERRKREAEVRKHKQAIEKEKKEAAQEQWILSQTLQLAVVSEFIEEREDEFWSYVERATKQVKNGELAEQEAPGTIAARIRLLLQTEETTRAREQAKYQHSAHKLGQRLADSILEKKKQRLNITEADAVNLFFNVFSQFRLPLPNGKVADPSRFINLDRLQKRVISLGQRLTDKGHLNLLEHVISEDQPEPEENLQIWFFYEIAECTVIRLKRERFLTEREIRQRKLTQQRQVAKKLFSGLLPKLKGKNREEAFGLFLDTLHGEQIESGQIHFSLETLQSVGFEHFEKWLQGDQTQLDTTTVSIVGMVFAFLKMRIPKEIIPKFPEDIGTALAQQKAGSLLYEKIKNDQPLLDEIAHWKNETSLPIEETEYQVVLCFLSGLKHFKTSALQIHPPKIEPMGLDQFLFLAEQGRQQGGCDLEPCIWGVIASAYQLFLLDFQQKKMEIEVKPAAFF